MGKRGDFGDAIILIQLPSFLDIRTITRLTRHLAVSMERFADPSGGFHNPAKPSAFWPSWQPDGTIMRSRAKLGHGGRARPFLCTFQRPRWCVSAAGTIIKLRLQRAVRRSEGFGACRGSEGRGRWLTLAAPPFCHRDDPALAAEGVAPQPRCRGCRVQSLCSRSFAKSHVENSPAGSPCHSSAATVLRVPTSKGIPT